VGATPARTLADADEMVRDDIATLLDLDDVSDLEITIRSELAGSIEIEAAEAIAMTRAIAAEQVFAATRLRAVTRALRAQGLSLSDTAAILHVSRARASQLGRQESTAS